MNQYTISGRILGLLRIDQRSISCGKQLHGKVSKIRGRFDSRTPVTIAADQVPDQCKRATDMGSETQINQQSIAEDKGN